MSLSDQQSDLGKARREQFIDSQTEGFPKVEALLQKARIKLASREYEVVDGIVKKVLEFEAISNTQRGEAVVIAAATKLLTHDYDRCTKLCSEVHTIPHVDKRLRAVAHELIANVKEIQGDTYSAVAILESIDLLKETADSAKLRVLSNLHRLLGDLNRIADQERVRQNLLAIEGYGIYVLQQQKDSHEDEIHDIVARSYSKAVEGIRDQGSQTPREGANKSRLRRTGLPKEPVLADVSITELLNAVAERTGEAAEYSDRLESIAAEVTLTKHAKVFGLTHANATKKKVNKWLAESKSKTFEDEKMLGIVEAMRFLKKHWKVKLIDKTDGGEVPCSMTAPKANDTKTSDLIFKTWRSTGGGLTTSKGFPSIELC